MEFNRRNFIKFFAGGVGGTLLSPLPWKLIDDIAIWTQNWSWVPVPARGKFSTVKSVCTLCSGACGIEARKINERLVKIEGRSDYPVNQGNICPLGIAGPQILYNEGIRWKAPMKRAGARGSGKWKEISWSRAMDELTDRMKALRHKGAPEKFAAIDGNPDRSTMAELIEGFLKSLGSPNYMKMPREEDTHSMVSFLMHGRKGPLAYDLENAGFILSFGCPLADGWGSPGRMFRALREWNQNGANVIQIEARASSTTSMANQWLAPKPGTESALAMGIAHVIIKEKLFSREFIENQVFGFNDWYDADGKEHKGFSGFVLEEYPPEKVEKITGIDRKEILDVARRFAAARAPVAIYGRGRSLLSGSLYEAMAIHSINALVGRINKPGGVILTDDLPLAKWPDAEYDEVAGKGIRKPRMDHAGGSRYPFTQNLVNKFAEAVTKGEVSPPEMLFVFSANPAFTMPDNKNLVRAIEKIPFIASFSPFRDETSMMADLILPDHTPLEKMSDIVSPAGIQYPVYALSSPVVKPVYNTRHSGDVIISLAKGIGGTVAGSFPWNNFEIALKSRIKGLYDSGEGMTSGKGRVPPWKKAGKKGIRPGHASFESMWKDIKENGIWYAPYHPVKEKGDLFLTPSRKFEFFSTNLELAIKQYSEEKSPDSKISGLAKGDKACMPHYVDIKGDSDEKLYPLALIPFEMINLSSGWVGNPPFLNKTLFDYQLKGDDLFIELNPETVSKYGLKEGSRVKLRSPKGELEVRVHIFEGAMPDVVFIPIGLGHTAYDRYLKGKGANPNEIIDSVEDQVSGYPVWWRTRVKLVKA